MPQGDENLAISRRLRCAIDFPPVADRDHSDNETIILNLIDDAILALPHPEEALTASEFGATGRPWVAGQTGYAIDQPLSIPLAREPLDGLGG